ncbi:MAG: tetratricopeptide repeat protein [Planctomycetota bacterium]
MTNDTNSTTDTTPFNPQRVVKRLAAAEGYLEIGLPTYAIAELNRVVESGPFEPIVQLFRGEALQAQEKFADAIAPLNRAAEMFPAPFNQRALMALSNCYRHQGQDRLADEAVAAAMPSDALPGSKLQVVVAPIFLIKSQEPGRSSRDDN